MTDENFNEVSNGSSNNEERIIPKPPPMLQTTKKKRRPYCLETNPVIRRRHSKRLMKKLHEILEEFSTRVGKQAVVIIARPKQDFYKVFGTQPLEAIATNFRDAILRELSELPDNIPTPVVDPTKHELPPLIIDGIPTPVDKMTQAQLRAFIPLMLKYSTGKGKPGWNKNHCKPVWWPDSVPWANVRMDVRSEEQKQLMSWTKALRQIIICCYNYHNRQDLLYWNLEHIEQEEQNEENENPIEEVKAEDNENGDIRYNATIEGLLNIEQLPDSVSQIVVVNADGTTSVIPVVPYEKLYQMTKEDGTVTLVTDGERTELDPSVIQMLNTDLGSQFIISSQNSQGCQTGQEVGTDPFVFRMVNIENDILSKSLGELKSEMIVE